MSRTEKPDSAYSRLCSTQSPTLAAYCLCAAYNVPYDADAVCDSWSGYLENLGDEWDGKGFEDGETDVNAAILGGMAESERWETVWGIGDEDNPYTENDYRRLDALYSTMTAQLDAVGGVIDKQQEDAARFCSMLALKREKRVASGDKEDIQVAKDLDKMIRDNLTDCNMRKRDVLPTQKQRPDGFVDALKKKTGLGPDMTQEQVLEVIFKWLKKKKYTMTTDAADHMLLAILKTMAKNDDLPEPVDLPEDMLCSNFGSEFADEPNEQEEQAYAYLGAVRGRFYDTGDGGED